MKYKIPYGKTYQEFEVNDKLLSKEIKSKQDELNNLAAGKSGSDIVKKAMDHPIASAKLEELAAEAKTCTLIISDHTRPVPSKDILPNMLKSLRDGNPDIDITLLVATGFHRGTKPNELRAKLGDKIYESEKIVIHDCRDKNRNVYLGTLPSGAPFEVDNLAADADLLISEGFIEPHFFAGFSGGRKSVLPGVCEKTTVMANHNGQFIDSPYARTGVLKNNPIHRDMIKAAELVGLKYIVNVVIDADHKTVAAFAGDFKRAHEEGCKFLKKYAAVKTEKFDIVVTGNGGAPLDQNVYQSVKSSTSAEACVKPGGIIINCSECADGHGGESFYEHLANCESTAHLEAQAKNTPILETPADQWEYQILARILKNNELVFVTKSQNEELVENMKMTYQPNAQEAVDYAIRKLKKCGIEHPTIGVIPNGVSIICN